MSLATRYMGLELANPVIVSSSGLTGSVEGIVRCAEAGAGAIVLKSLYEEQIHAEADAVLERSHLPTGYPEGRDHLELYSQEQAFERYLKLIREAKEAVSIPVIASVHCVSASGWTEYTRRIQAAGADALELNVFVLPMDIEREPRAYEKLYLDIVKGVRRNVSVPLALKIGPYFSGLAHTALELSWRVDALVLFNRFYRLDIDIEELRVVPAEPFSDPQECVIPMRWIAILAGQIECDLAASTGVHDGASVVKQLLAGATAVQVCSALYRHQDIGYLGTILDGVTDWMARHRFARVADFRGLLSQAKNTDPQAFERVQFMRETADRGLTSS
ncbi:MAG: dihydroorotate dehydrogenase-like protein [Polyangiales bacterium]